ncbi:MAG: adenosylcobinamide-GDP ribazoletransferase [Elainellaceae cyanobacterium]
MRAIKLAVQHFFGAVAFYTCIPIPTRWNLQFQLAARNAPFVGLLIGALLVAVNTGLYYLYGSTLTRAVAIVLTWLWVTGGLHLDGSMDSADGLAVTDPTRRLSVMVDSQTGAFGAMVAIAILLLKVAALTDFMVYPLMHQNMMLFLVPAWGRWGQQLAIARYPYLKPTGKGAFHKAAIPSVWFCLPAYGVLLSLHLLWAVLTPLTFLQSGAIALLATAIASFTGAWFHYRLGGHTGDTYGAVVEWTEALVFPLSLLAFIS